ncbi:MAG: hypothetical protein L0211_17925 [Planctomycetaceae bacterium]|nr:hypothetical protein [Planctomycetaceae bacterium]
MSDQPSTAPSGSQFSLRGIFILITAVSVILALLSLAIRQPYQWLGTLGIIAFSLAVIGLLELFRKLFPPKPPFPKYQPPGTNPFGSPPGAGEFPFMPPNEPPGDDGQAAPQ